MRATWTLLMVLVITGSALAYDPRPDEYSLLALANRDRAENNQTPYLWSNDLAEAARSHSIDTATNFCFQHDSCDGETWVHRIERYYKPHFGLGENIAGGGSDPRTVHAGWMASPGHRANILGYFVEFGSGIAVSDAAHGSFSYSTEDFGIRATFPLAGYTGVIAGGVIPRLHYVTEARNLLVNYYDVSGKPPLSVAARIGTTCVQLPRISGTAANGTYGGDRFFLDLCTPVVFEAVRADGVAFRWPPDKAIMVGVGLLSIDCGDYQPLLPGDCGGGVFPPAEPILSKTRLTLTGRLLDDRDHVLLTTTLPLPRDFDPTGVTLALRAELDGVSVWEIALPTLCDSAPCLRGNAQKTVFRSHYIQPDATVIFSLREDGWHFRLTSSVEQFGDLRSGVVDLNLVIDNTAAISGRLTGTQRGASLVAVSQ